MKGGDLGSLGETGVECEGVGDGRLAAALGPRPSHVRRDGGDEQVLLETNERRCNLGAGM